MRTVNRTHIVARPDFRLFTRYIAPAMMVLLAMPGGAAAEEIVTRLRVTIEAPEPIALRGGIELSEGRLERLQPLNLDATAAAALSLEKGRLRFHHRRLLTRDVFDVTVRSEPDAEMIFSVQGDASEPPQTGQVSLSAARASHQTISIGDSGVVAQVARLASDRLRVETARTTLRFAPGEEFEFDVLADPLGIERGRPYEFTAGLLEGRRGKVLWRSESSRVEAIADGATRLPISVPLPTTEGVYMIRLRATRPAGFLSRFSAPSAAPAALAERIFQVVVFDPEKPPQKIGDWRETYTVDPRTPSKWTRHVPSWMRLSGLPWSADTALTSEDRPDPRQGAAIVIAPRDQDAAHWRAYPLPVEQLGETYAVEIEQLGEPGESITIAVLEPDALGDLHPISGAITSTIPRWNTGDPREPLKLVVEPQTDSPLLVIANPSRDRAARFGTIRLLRSEEVQRDEAASERVVALDWSGCDLPHLVGASHTAAEGGGHEQPDLQTYFETAQRIADRVELSGANAAVLSVNENGSAIYPSQLWNAPRFDLGVWSDGAADVPRRELLSLIAAEFRRRGLKLVPALQFDAPVASHEAASNDPVYVAGSPSLAAAQRAAVRELIDAIGDPDVIACVAVRLTPGGWGLLSASNQDSEATARLVKSYDELASELQRLATSETDLVLLPSALRRDPTLARHLTPRFGASNPRAVEILDRFGLRALLETGRNSVAAPFGGRDGLPGAPRLSGTAMHEVLRESLGESRPTPVRSFHAERQAVRLYRSAQRLRTNQGTAPDDIVLPTIVAEPRAEASLLASSLRGPTRLITLDGATAAGFLSPIPIESRRAFLQAPRPNDDGEPNVANSDVHSDVIATASDIDDSQSRITITNQSAWKRTASLTIETPKRLRGRASGEAEWFQAGRHALRVELEPYRSTNWLFDGAGVRVTGLRIEPNPTAQRELAAAVADLQSRDTKARRPFERLPNPSFELQSDEDSIVGWQTGSGVTLDQSDPFEGTYSVQLKGDATKTTVLTSEPFPMPTTGQLALGLRLRPGEFDPKAELRIDVIEVNGDYRNGARYTGAQFNAAVAGTGEAWLPPILFPIDDLPLSRAGQLQLRFTLSGKGTLNLDKLEAEDVVLPLDGFGSIELRREKFALVRLLSASQSLLDEGRLEACRELIDSYWAQFLITNFPEHQAEQTIASENEAPSEADGTEPEATPSIGTRLRGYLPRWWQ